MKGARKIEQLLARAKQEKAFACVLGVLISPIAERIVLYMEISCASRAVIYGCSTYTMVPQHIPLNTRHAIICHTL